MIRSLVAGVAEGSIYGLLGLGIIVIHRNSRIFNLAHGHIGTLAVLSAGALDPKMWPWGAVFAVIIGGVVAAGFFRIVIERIEADDHSSMTVATLGLSLLLFVIMVNVRPSASVVPSPMASGVGIFGYQVSSSQLLAFATTVLISIALSLFFDRTKLGLATAGVSLDQTAAQMVGLPVRWISALSWAGGGAIAAAAVLFAAPVLGVIGPAFSTGMMVRGVAAAIVGGLERPFGALMGGVAVGVIDSVVGHFTVASSIPGLSTFILLTVVVTIIWLRPQGLLAAAPR